MQATPAVLDEVDKRTIETRDHLATIKERWFQALDMQAQCDNLTRKITSKVDMVSSLQEEVTNLIDNVSNHIDSFEVVNVDGESSDMQL